MRYSLIIFLILFFIQSNHGQQISPLFVSDNNDKVWGIIELELDKFLVTKNRYYNTPFYELNDSTANELILYDLSLHLLTLELLIRKNKERSKLILYVETLDFVNIEKPLSLL